MRYPIILLCFVISSLLSAQTEINGKIYDQKGKPIEGANVYLEGTYDGATSDENGLFSFNTNEIGIKKLVVSILSYETKSLELETKNMKDLVIRLREDVDNLDTVIISAGTFEANDNSKVSVLKPLDVVTTASAVGDFLGALQTLPGTSTVSEDGRLFVRGGTADETQIFIDGIRVFTPYTPTANNVPTRGRYSPFLFDGITFSTGGYSAEFGNALSSVLLLNTIDEPDQEKTDIGIMTVGANLGRTEKWSKCSLSVNASYLNLAPYIALFPDRNNWHKPYSGGQGEAVFRQQFNSGLLKFYTAFDASSFSLTQEDINNPSGLKLDLNNRNLYTSLSYKGVMGDGWSIHSGLSYTITKDAIDINNRLIETDQKSAHLKLKLKRRFNSRFKLSFGTEYLATGLDENYENGQGNFDYGFDSQNTAVFAESDLIFSKSFAVKMGLRSDYYSLTDNLKVSPRVSLAYKMSQKGQLSLAYGSFFQSANSDVLKLNWSLDEETANHYILNYQYINDGRLFRAELYRKNYNNLVKFETEPNGLQTNFSNLGNGYSQGLDLFWRDNQSLKNFEYWLSYSYLDTKRDFRDYPSQAQPSFANTHNFSAVGKYWIDEWKSQIGFSYTFASGRSYDNPSTASFMTEQTKSFNSLSVNWAYLLSPQKILYLSINNVLGFNNINGYQYANKANNNDSFDRRELRPAADQFFFIGFFWTISDDGKDNQLNNL